VVYMPVIPAMERINRKIVVQASVDKKWNPISKLTRAKNAGGMTQVVKHLPSKCEAPCSSPSTTKNIRGETLGLTGLRTIDINAPENKSNL
jgi:hypothetical protein